MVQSNPSTAISAQNTFTAGILPSEHGVSVVVSGTFSATLNVQCSPDEGSTWVDSGDTITAPGSYAFEDLSRMLWRVGVKTGDYVSGTATVYLRSA